MISTRLLLTSMLVSSTLIMGACGNKDKGASEKIADNAVQALKGGDVSERSFEKLLKVDKRSTSEAEAQTALEKMGFDTNDGALKWAESAGSDGNYTYTNLSASGDDGENIAIAELTLTGVHMVGDDPAFDKVDMSGIRVTEDDNVASVGRLSISNPSPKLSAAIVKFVENIDSLDDLDMDIDLDEGEVPFGAMLMNDLNVKSDDANVDLETLGWAEEDDKGVFMLEGLNVDAKSERNEAPVKISLASMSGTGLDMNHFRDMQNAAKGSKKSGGFSPFAKTFDNFSVKDVAISVDTLNLTTAGMEGSASEKGDVTTIKQSIKPFKLFFTGNSQDRDMAKLQQTLASAGFDQIEFSAGSTSKLNAKADTFDVTDSYVNVKDAFDINFSYGGSGLAAMKARAETGGEMSSADVQRMLEGMSLGYVDMSLTDNSIIDKLLNVAAQQQGTTPAMMKMQAKSGLMMLGLAAQNEAQGKALTDLSAALGKLLDEGGTINISLRPEEPVAVGKLKNLNPQAMDPEKLGFSVSHKK